MPGILRAVTRTVTRPPSRLSPPSHRDPAISTELAVREIGPSFRITELTATFPVGGWGGVLGPVDRSPRLTGPTCGSDTPAAIGEVLGHDAAVRHRHAFVAVKGRLCGGWFDEEEEGLRINLQIQKKYEIK